MIDTLLWIAVIALVVGGVAAIVMGGAALVGLIRAVSGAKSDPAIPVAPEAESKPRLSTWFVDPPSDRHGERCTVYLVAELNADFDPPRVVHLSPYTSSADQLTRAGGNDCKVNLAVGYGDTYADARRQIQYQIETYPWLKWAHRWLAEDRGHIGSPSRYCTECGSLLPKDPLVQEARKALAEANAPPDETATLRARIEELETQQRESDATKAYALGYQRGREIKGRA